MSRHTTWNCSSYYSSSSLLLDDVYHFNMSCNADLSHPKDPLPSSKIDKMGLRWVLQNQKCYRILLLTYSADRLHKKRSFTVHIFKLNRNRQRDVSISTGVFSKKVSMRTGTMTLMIQVIYENTRDLGGCWHTARKHCYGHLIVRLVHCTVACWEFLSLKSISVVSNFLATPQSESVSTMQHMLLRICSGKHRYDSFIPADASGTLVKVIHEC